MTLGPMGPDVSLAGVVVNRYRLDAAAAAEMVSSRPKAVRDGNTLAVVPVLTCNPALLSE